MNLDGGIPHLDAQMCFMNNFINALLIFLKILRCYLSARVLREHEAMFAQMMFHSRQVTTGCFDRCSVFLCMYVCVWGSPLRDAS